MDLTTLTCPHCGTLLQDVGVQAAVPATVYVDLSFEDDGALTWGAYGADDISFDITERYICGNCYEDIEAGPVFDALFAAEGGAS